VAKTIGFDAKQHAYRKGLTLRRMAEAQRTGNLRYLEYLKICLAYLEAKK